MVKLVKNTIRSVKPEVAFTIGPQGNYDNNYSTQYIDMPKVCAAKLIEPARTTIPRDLTGGHRM